MTARPDRSLHRRARAAAVAAFTALLSAPSASAQDANARPYLVGSRAAGMGGAFTALADDGSGPFYNPGGVGFVRRSQLSLSGSVYGVASGTTKDALGAGHDFKFSTLQTLPTATAAVFKLGPDDPERANVVALTVYVPDAVLLDGRDTIAGPANAFLLSAQSQTVWAGATYARRWGRLSIGVSGFLLYGTDSTQLDVSHVSSTVDCQAQAVTCSTDFSTITARAESTTYGAVGAIGARWDATDNVRLGLAIYSPEVGFGSRRVLVRLVQTTANGALAAVENVDGLHASPTLPMRIQAGVAWTSGRFTAALDATYLGPRDVSDDADRAGEELDRRTTRNAVLNGSIGAEYVIADRFPVRGGFFTDLSSADEPDPGSVGAAKVHRYGGSLSIGLRTEHTATDVGVMVSGGSGTDLIPTTDAQGNFDFSSYRRASTSQLFTYLFLGTSYQF